MDALLLLGRLALSGVFVLAAAGKVLDQAGTRRALEEFGLSRRAAGLGRLLLPAAELAVGLGLIAGPSARWAAIGGLVLLGVFFLAVARVIRAGRSPDCHCFGQINAHPVGTRTLGRIVVFAVPAAVIALAGAGDRLGLHGTRATKVGLLTGAVVVLAALALALWQENRRLRRPLASVSLLGSLAPSLALADLAGNDRQLAGELDPELPSVLVFLSPACQPCLEFVADLERWQVSLREQISILALANGRPDDQPTEFRSPELGLLLHHGGPILGEFGVHLTPAAVVVGADRRISSRPAEGSLAIEALIRTTLSPPTGSQAVRAGA
ncbi:MAG: hypothetical protein QOH12_3686 [Solirubrobacteraceae bacterium]|nr:hypothetical protein [Solirubrobacteraceae bacterium]